MILTEVLESIRDDLKGLRDVQGEHSETLARLDERTMQYEKRMDRTDRRTVGVAGVTTAGGGSLLLFVKQMFGGPNS